MVHRPGIEPGPPAWQASILPLNKSFEVQSQGLKHIVLTSYSSLTGTATDYEQLRKFFLRERDLCCITTVAALVDATIDFGPSWVRTPRSPKSIRKRHPFPLLLSRAEKARNHLREIASCLHHNAKVIDEAVCMLVYCTRAREQQRRQPERGPQALHCREG